MIHCNGRYRAKPYFFLEGLFQQSTLSRYLPFYHAIRPLLPPEYSSTIHAPPVTTSTPSELGSASPSSSPSSLRYRGPHALATPNLIHPPLPACTLRYTLRYAFDQHPSEHKSFPPRPSLQFPFPFTNLYSRPLPHFPPPRNGGRRRPC